MKTIILISLGLLVFSCKKKEVGQFPASITIGHFDETFTFDEYTNQVRLQYTQIDSVQNLLIGTDSIDIDLDGHFDFSLQSYDILDSTKNKPSSFFYKFVPIGDFQISNFVKFFNTPYGNFSERYATKLVLGDKFYYEEQKWDGPHANLWYWNTNLPIPRGPWNGVNGIYQVGIRKMVNGIYKYGWLTLNIVSRDEIYFINYALQN